VPEPAVSKKKNKKARGKIPPRKKRETNYRGKEEGKPTYKRSCWVEKKISINRKGGGGGSEGIFF